VQLAEGTSINCGLLGDGTVKCCPHIVDGGIHSECTSVEGLTGVIRIAAQSARACAILLDGTVWCWGHSYDGTIPSTSEFAPSPIQIRGVQDAAEIALGYSHSCALRNDGTILCWGKNDKGQLGIGSVDDGIHEPERVELPF
jgi:alpha-tubulin suppressor-like RCC1 family protein